MNTTGWILAVGVVLLAALFIAVRLYLTRDQGDQLVEHLLDILHAPRCDSADGLPRRFMPFVCESCVEGLLLYFARASLSRGIIEILGRSEAGAREAEIMATVNALATGNSHGAIPPLAVRRVISILTEAEFVTRQNGVLLLTSRGRHLHCVLAAFRRSALDPGRTPSSSH